MKPFQFLKVLSVPELGAGKSIQNHVQLTFTGENEEICTSLTLEAEGYEGELSLWRIKSRIRHKTLGYVKTLIDGDRREINFSEYLEPVDFAAYLDRTRGIMIFQAPKKTCRGVLDHLRKSDCGVNLSEMKVDFGRVFELQPEYRGAWFKRVSSRVRSAGLSGDMIQDDELFKYLSQIGSMSNVTIPWEFRGLEHDIMITTGGAAVLVQRFNEISLELNLVVDVHDRLLVRVWNERDPR